MIVSLNCVLSQQHLNLLHPAMPPVGPKNGSRGNHPALSDEPASHSARVSGMLPDGTPADVCCGPFPATSPRSCRQMYSGRWDTPVRKGPLTESLLLRASATKYHKMKDLLTIAFKLYFRNHIGQQSN